MGCCGQKDTTAKFGTIEVCDVCKYVDKNTEKKPVKWCDFCSAYVCKGHWYDMRARNKARKLRNKEREANKNI